jgi:hypothetical protein
MTHLLTVISTLVQKVAADQKHKCLSFQVNSILLSDIFQFYSSNARKAFFFFEETTELPYSYVRLPFHCIFF